jgi:hypothetical protein
VSTPLRALVVVALTALTGCPREVAQPDRADGVPCERTADCNAGATCGELRICADGLCEGTPSLFIPCP